MSADDFDKQIEEYFVKLETEEGATSEELQEVRDLLKEGEEAKEELPASEFLSNDEIEYIEEEYEEDKAEEEEVIRDIRVRISKMSISEKLKLALRGDALARFLLITNPNQMIQLAVLKNPMIKDSEIEAFSKNKNVSKMVIKAINSNKRWMKNYVIKLNLVMNPKTPGDISLKWINYIRKAELRKIAKSKNIPNLVVVTARKRLQAMEQSGKA